MRVLRRNVRKVDMSIQMTPNSISVIQITPLASPNRRQDAWNGQIALRPKRYFTSQVRIGLGGKKPTAWILCCRLKPIKMVFQGDTKKEVCASH